jgi:hypothetical protein
MMRIAMLMACFSVGQVGADAFDTSQLTASDFDTLGTLADKWESKSKELAQKSPDAEITGMMMLGHSLGLKEAAGDLRGTLNRIKDKKNTFDVAQVTGQDFGQRPPVPVSPEFEKQYPQPQILPMNPPAPDQVGPVPQPTQKQVQAPATACGMQMQSPMYKTNYSSGGRFRLFGRRASGGGFRLFGRRGGC